jgi:hypothetical protein
LSDNPCPDDGLGVNLFCEPFASACAILSDPDCHPVGGHGTFVCKQDPELNDPEHGYGTPCNAEWECAGYDEVSGWSRDVVTCVPAAFVPDCSTARCCTLLCDLSDANPDTGCPGVAAGEACLPYFQPGAAPPGLDHVGICRLP